MCNIAIERRATVYAQFDADPPGVELPAPLAGACRRAGLAHALTASTNDFPVGAGLGGSSAYGVALAAALATLRELQDDPDIAVPSLDLGELAERSRAVEVEEMGIAGGFQDHYAAAYGGALALSLTGTTAVERIPLPVSVERRLERRCVLAYTGESRISAVTITAVLEAYRAREPRVTGALDRMALLARMMRDALAAGDIDALAAHVDEHWAHQRALHPAITTERIDAIETAARAAGAAGMKALGASGGGCVIVFTPEDETGAIRRAIAPLVTFLDWSVARDGVLVSIDR